MDNLKPLRANQVGPPNGPPVLDGNSLSTFAVPEGARSVTGGRLPSPKRATVRRRSPCESPLGAGTSHIASESLEADGGEGYVGLGEDRTSAEGVGAMREDYQAINDGGALAGNGTWKVGVDMAPDISQQGEEDGHMPDRGVNELGQGRTWIGKRARTWWVPL